jgi:hypothetical protein
VQWTKLTSETETLHREDDEVRPKVNNVDY